MQQPSIFTKIINGEIPSHKVYEDEHTYAFMDIHPIEEGHVLVVPKLQVPFIWDLPESEYQALMATVQKVGIRLREVYAHHKRVGIHVEGFDVEDHAHVKVFPFSDSETFASHPDFEAEPDHDKLAEQAKQLYFE